MRKQFFLSLALFWTGVITFFCLIKSSDIPQVNIENLDKVIHTFFHFVFTSLWYLFFKKHIKSSFNIKPLGFSIVLSIVFGIVIEILQEFCTTTRTADVNDVLANLTGAILAIAFVTLVNKFKILENFRKKFL